MENYRHVTHGVQPMPPDFPPHMTAAEIALLSEVVHEGSRVLEFGCGGSTLLFFEKGAKHLVSIDSDKGWLEDLLRHPVIATFHKHGRWLPFHTGIGPIKDWGAPAAQAPQICWLNYHQHCWAMFPNQEFDLVLVDGRFRVACLCQALLRCNTESVIFAVHDFWHRTHYHSVLEFIEPLHKKDSLGIFKPKENIDWRKLNLVLQAHQFDPA